jgi:hypothetical protein
VGSRQMSKFSELERKTIVNHWLDRLRFLWEEEAAPPEEVPRQEYAGVPRPLRQATRFALIAVVATSLMSQVIGIQLLATANAAATDTVSNPNHFEVCSDNCCKGTSWKSIPASCKYFTTGFSFGSQQACRDACKTAQPGLGTHPQDPNCDGPHPPKGCPGGSGG